MPSLRKRKGVIQPHTFVKPVGSSIFVPKGSSAIKKIELLQKREAKEKIEQAKRKNILPARRTPSEIERELITLLEGREVEIKGRYKMDRFILSSNGHKLTILYRGRPSGEARQVKELDRLSLALNNAAIALRL